jgi:hypothetical protein
MVRVRETVNISHDAINMSSQLMSAGDQWSSDTINIVSKYDPDSP